MQHSIEEHLTTIEHLMARGERAEPERLLTDLINQMGTTEVSVWRRDILRIVERFQKKRRNKLLSVLNDSPEIPSIDENEIKEKPTNEYTLTLQSPIILDFARALNELEERHIYQWSTFYQDCINEHLSNFLEEIKRSAPHGHCDPVTDTLSDHARSIFSSGYQYVRKRRGHSDAIHKSVAGLSSFLELPLLYYSVRTSHVSGYRSAWALRTIVSAAICGIIRGYSAVKFGNTTGQQLLPKMQRHWVHFMAFLTPHHAAEILNNIESGPLQNGLQISAVPLLEAIQKFFQRLDEDYFPLPVIGQYMWNQRRLDVSVRPPSDSESQRLMEANAFLDEGLVSTSGLEDAVGRQVTLVIAPLRPDLANIVEERPILRSIVVPAQEGQGAYATDESFKLLDDAIFALRSKRRDAFPITYNFAREFPLRDANRAKFFHVPRTSVRDLLKTFERRNGVRLWCSVRRSGKTTACFDLGSTTGDSIIISQTCGMVQQSDADMFFRKTRDAIYSKKSISDSFVADAVSNCSPMSIENKRLVFILDEYETFFGLLKSAMKEESTRRYTVVQPILNQLMKFAYDNLLVFLGQQPDAHFILMDQNQLAPNVDQDFFPLFEHRDGTTTGEFSELVRKIFGGRIDCSPEFLGAVFEETAGHPYLTANVLAEFVDWLIEKRRPQVGLRVDKIDFTHFTRSKLRDERILLSNDYEFFRHAASAAMSMDGYKLNPWLYTVYWVLRLMAKRGLHGRRIRTLEFDEMISNIPIPEGDPIPSSTEILRTASQANFLSHDRYGVRIKIRILGRITAAVQPSFS